MKVKFTEPVFFFILPLFFVLLAFPAFAQDDYDSYFDMDELFGNFDAAVETIDEGARTSAASSLGQFLISDTVKIGGQWNGSIGPEWSWNDPWHDGFDIADPDSERLSLNLGALLYFEARPDEDTKFYGSIKTSWPFQKSAEGITAPNIQVFELFGDRAWNDTLFFRFGKHTAKWGVGYFWSPADVINLSPIDLLDAEAQREGPISLRLHIPVPRTQNNFWLYAIVPGGKAPGDLVFQDIGYAGKFEFLLGNYEIGTGIFWQRDLAPKAMLTATGSLWRFNLFGELVAGWGSDKTFIDKIALLPGPDPVQTKKYDEGVFVSGTAGFMYSDTKNNWNAMLQYYFNGDGYSNSERERLLDEGHSVIDQLSIMFPENASALNQMLRYMFIGSGQHYLAASLGKSELFTKDLGASILTVTNLSDLSGMVRPSLSYRFFNGFSGSFFASFSWAMDGLWGGGEDAEYVVLSDGPAVSFGFSFTLGSGRF